MDTPTTALAADPLTGRVLDRRYELGAPIARGGMAKVYHARDQRLDRSVAVKVMHSAFAHDPDFVRRFEREAKAAARINDPNVVAVHDTGTDGEGRDQVVYLVMELVRGQTLRELLGTRGHLSAYRALDVLEPILMALSAAHRAGLVHRDVKPENVLLSDDGAVKVTDFGLVRSADESGFTGPVILGTAAYLAPEQVKPGSAQISQATDVYAAGICLFEMLTGATPYAGEDPRAVAYRRLHEAIPPVSTATPGLPPAIDELVARATATDPADRYADAAEFLAAVRAARRALPTPPPSRAGDTTALPIDQHLTENLGAPQPPTAAATRPPRNRPAASTPRRHRRRTLVFVLLFALLCAAAAVSGWWFGSGRYVTVPQLAGLTTAQASNALRSRHLEVSTGAPVHSDTVREGLVAADTPADGKRVTRGSRVTLHLSAGVLTITVPPVAGKSAADARAALTLAGLRVGAATSVYDDSVPSGHVIATTPTAGTALDHRKAVSLTISQGPAPVQLPKVVGQAQSQAVDTLTGLGLHPQVSVDFSDTVPAGRVISQDPNPGIAHHGDTVAVVVSKGPQLVEVPSIGGKSAGQATKKLRDAGLVPNEHDLFGIAGRVVAYSPHGKVKRGTVITFYTA